MAAVRCLTLAVLLFVGILACGSINGVTSQSCEGDLKALREPCEPYVLKLGGQTTPSQACCDEVKKVNVSCVCHHITKEVEVFVDVKKLIHVATYCGNPIPSGTKCGSVTIPTF